MIHSAISRPAPPLLAMPVIGVVVAAFGIVVVRNDRSIDTDGTQDVETIQPAGRLTGLVDLIDRERATTQRERRCGCKRDDAAVTKFGNQQLWQ